MISPITKEPGYTTSEKSKLCIYIDKYCKKNLPTVILYDENENIVRVTYQKDGKLHNLDGPSSIEYDKNQNIIRERYFIKGIQYSKTKWRKLRKEVKC